MKNFLLFLLASFLIVALFLPIFLIKLILLLINRKSISDYFLTCAIGLDQLMGSIFYNEPDWTISGYTYHLCLSGNKKACYFKKFIDFLFGKGHCEKTFFHEVEQFKSYVKN